MLDTQSQDPQCTACGSPMKLTAIAPGAAGQSAGQGAEHDLRTFTCPRCKRIQRQSDAGSSRDSPTTENVALTLRSEHRSHDPERPAPQTYRSHRGSLPLPQRRAADHHDH